MPRPAVGNGQRRLRAVGRDDIESIRLWRNAQMSVLRQAKAITRQEQISYFEQHIWPSLDQPQPANILLAYEEDRNLIGYGGLVHVAWEHRRAEVSFLLKPQLTTEIQVYSDYFGSFLALLKEAAFTDLSLERVWTETYAIRRHHVEVLESSGFRLEGVMRRHVLIDGQFTDSLIHGCLRDDD
ncbi:GNAT family N-acetyltransferase [Sphingomonas sp.]|jgi:RimJ/RimL family protein N-acetyltransferase|uniref:GNAT family N-acetyltransferase n=1 Tax=Sphingomonas sp. TaxID=28214 RepID=UPI002DED6150|nr:GNAT family N-acetyltransferase [Sphingomonas sp.]